MNAEYFKISEEDKEKETALAVIDHILDLYNSYGDEGECLKEWFIEASTKLKAVNE